MSARSTMCLMYLLSEIMKNTKNSQSEKTQENKETPKECALFSEDETGAVWQRQENMKLLLEFCREGYSLAKKYGHFITGNAEAKSYIGIPGRFLKAEQPAWGDTGFTLWQPLKGGEMYMENSEDDIERIYGYWIAELDPETLKLSEPE